MTQLDEEIPGTPLAARAPVRPDCPTFAELGARPETVDALAAAGITRSFAIQEYALPIALRGSRHDRPGPDRYRQDPRLRHPPAGAGRRPGEGADGSAQALVVVPTRELGLQVARDIAAAGSTRGVRVLPIYGGVAYEPQIDALNEGVEIVVGTPGRLLDLAGRRASSSSCAWKAYGRWCSTRPTGCSTSASSTTSRRSWRCCRTERQTMLFSATMPDPIVTLARRFLRQPVTIHAGHAADRRVAADQAGRLPHPLAQQGGDRRPHPAGRRAAASR